MKKPPRLLQKIDPNVVMRPIRWPEEIVTGGVSHAPFSHIEPYTGYPGIPSEDGVKVVSWNVNGLDCL
ncbi:hypothetical protein DIPPA_16432 [Diplonema papillatum]|nr:hypothetical protein DIPPA_16432 [Diplonema papillatum]